MNSFELIIWDCDGCLVDSELIACSVPAAIATAYGFPITTQEYLDRFAGQTAGTGIAELARANGCDALGEAYEKEVYQATLDGLTQGLKPIAGLADVLRRLTVPMCVASGSAVERNRHSLSLVGLLPFFDGHIYSSSQVAQGKPAPDIFLFAAAQMGADPARCLVIEDSVHGVRAAKAAGMTVFAYMGGSHVNAHWRERIAAEEPDIIFDDYAQLLPLMQKASITP